MSGLPARLTDGISIVLPAYNEEESIEQAVERALLAAATMATEYEVIIVDDGSSDATGKLGEGLAVRHHPRVRLIRHRENRGYGAALRTGFAYSCHELVFFTDSDNQFDVGDLRYFLPLIEQNDMVVGFRVYRYDPPLRVLVSWLYNRMVGVMFRVRIRDVDCAFKLMRREVLDMLDLESDDFFVSMELVARARKWNFRIAEKGVKHYPRRAGEAKVLASDVPRTLRTMARMWQRIYVPTRGQLSAQANTREPGDNSFEFMPSQA